MPIFIAARARPVAVVRGGIGDQEAADEAEAAVDADMVLLAEHRHRDRSRGLALQASVVDRQTLAAVLTSTLFWFRRPWGVVHCRRVCRWRPVRCQGRK